MLKRLFLSSVLTLTLLSAETATERNIAQLYVATFNRAPDASGLAYWLKSGLTLEEVANSFFEQKETRERYPQGLEGKAFIRAVYGNIFGRVPKGAGYDYWLEELEKGKISRSDFILAVGNGAQGDDARVLHNKMEIGLAYANSGHNGLEGAMDVMKVVTADSKSINKALCEYSLIGCVEPPKPDFSSPANQAPVANAGNDFVFYTYTSPTTIGLDGSASSDHEGSLLTFHWNIAIKPTGSSAKLSDKNATRPTFDADIVGDYSFTLLVNDGTLDSSLSGVTVQVRPGSNVKWTMQMDSYDTNGVAVTDGSLKDNGFYWMLGRSTSWIRDDVKEIVTDNLTGLEWQDDINSTNKIKDWNDAKTYCSTLALDGGGWRLPTVEELYGAIEEGCSNPTSSMFMNVNITNRYWTSTTCTADTSKAWTIFFGNAGFSTIASDKNENRYYVLRCVR